MQYFDLLQAILLAFWLPIFVLVTFYFYWQRIIKREKDRNHRDIIMMEKESRMETNYKIERSLEEMRSFIPSMIEKQMESSLSRLRNELRYPIDKNLDRFEFLLNSFKSDIQIQLEEKPKIISSQANEKIIRELSHALNTPLSQLEASLISLKVNKEKHTKVNPEFEEIIKSTESSLNLCKAILAAYRELLLATKSTSVWSPSSFENSVKTAIDVYIKESHKNLDSDINLPESIDDYSNNYLTALLLPAIENAVEHGISNSSIKVEYEKTDSSYELKVINSSDTIPNKNIYEDGFSTKKNHTGNGLSIIQNLLSAYDNASITHKNEGNVVTFTISLPNNH